MGHWRLDRESESIDWFSEPDGEPPIGDGEDYLRLAELDLEDLDSIDAWLQVNGAMGMRMSHEGNFLPDDEWQGFVMHDGFAAVQRTLLEARGLASERIGRDPEETLAEFRFGASCVKDLVTAWRVVQGDLALDRADWTCPVWESAESKIETYPWQDRISEAGGNPFRDDGPAALINLYVSEGLRSFAPRVLLPFQGPEPFKTYTVPNYNVYCLELFNHIVEKTEYKTCENETCGRQFVRQSGRSVHGQHRTKGIMYCSAECSRAQAQRQYRRRKRKNSADLTVRPLSVERDVSDTTILRAPVVNLPVASDWIQRTSEDPESWVRATWDVQWEEARVVSLLLDVESSAKQRLRIVFDPDNRDHLACAYNSTAPGSIEIRSPDTDEIQIATIMEQSIATLVGFRYPGLIGHSAAVESATKGAYAQDHVLQDERLVDQSQRAQTVARNTEYEYPAISSAIETGTQSGILAFLAGELDPPPFNEPASLEIDRASLIAIGYLLEIDQAKFVRAPLRSPGPPPSNTRITGLVSSARAFVAGKPDTFVVFEFGQDGRPEILQLPDGTNWPLWAAFVEVEKLDGSDDRTLNIGPVGRLVDDSPVPMPTCGITLGPKGHRDAQALCLDEDGLHLPEQLFAKPTTNHPKRREVTDLDEQDIRVELSRYWSMLVPALTERVLSEVERYFQDF